MRKIMSEKILTDREIINVRNDIKRHALRCKVDASRAIKFVIAINNENLDKKSYEAGREFIDHGDVLFSPGGLRDDTIELLLNLIKGNNHLLRFEFWLSQKKTESLKGTELVHKEFSRKELKLFIENHPRSVEILSHRFYMLNRWIEEKMSAETAEQKEKREKIEKIAIAHAKEEMKKRILSFVPYRRSGDKHVQWWPVIRNM